MDNLHKEAENYFGITFGKADSEKSVKSARKLFEESPAFLDVAGPGDHQLAADLIIQGIEQSLVRLLDFIMMARPSFSSAAAHSLFAMELAKAASAQGDALAQALLVPAVNMASLEVDALPEEKRRAVLERSRARAISNIEKMFEEAFGAQSEESN